MSDLHDDSANRELAKERWRSFIASLDALTSHQKRSLSSAFLNFLEQESGSSDVQRHEKVGRTGSDTSLLRPIFYDEIARLALALGYSLDDARAEANKTELRFNRLPGQTLYLLRNAYKVSVFILSGKYLHIDVAKVSFDPYDKSKGADNPLVTQPILAEPYVRDVPKSTVRRKNLRALLLNDFDYSVAEARMAERDIERCIIDRLRAEKIANLVPPSRKFVPREDKIVDFLKDVWSDWIALDALTQPVLLRHDEKAYNALNHFMKQSSLPVGMSIPSKAELLARELADPLRVRDARRIARAADRAGVPQRELT